MIEPNIFVVAGSHREYDVWRRYHRHGPQSHYVWQDGDAQVLRGVRGGIVYFVGTASQRRDIEQIIDVADANGLTVMISRCHPDDQRLPLLGRLIRVIVEEELTAKIAETCCHVCDKPFAQCECEPNLEWEGQFSGT